jgi:glutamine synthetase
VYEKGKSAEGKKRVEFRTPDTSANPYLAFAAVASAGLDGIKKKLDPGSPVDEDIYKLTPDKRKKYSVGSLPTNLAEALEALKSDDTFLKDVFSSSLIETIIDLETENFNAVSARPHPYEFYLYFDI